MRPEGCQDFRILFLRNHPIFNGVGNGGFIGEKAGLLDHRLKGHTGVGTEESEDHIQMDERVRLKGQFLRNDGEAGLVSVCLQQVFDTLGIGAYTAADTKKIIADNLHVTAFGTRRRIQILSAERLCPKEILKDSLIDERFPCPHLKRHGVDQRTVEDT